MGKVKISYPDCSIEFEAADGVVPCRFTVGDKVRSSGHEVLETVERVCWIRDVWHGVEPYWRIDTDCSSAPQSLYCVYKKKK